MADPNDRLNRSIIGGNIRRNHPEIRGRELERAIDAGCRAWEGQTGNGKAADIGVQIVKDQRERG